MLPVSTKAILIDFTATLSTTGQARISSFCSSNCHPEPIIDLPANKIAATKNISIGIHTNNRYLTLSILRNLYNPIPITAINIPAISKKTLRQME